MTTDTETMPDLFLEGGRLVTAWLSPTAHARYEQALWYAWGRDDAGDHALRGDSRYYLGNDFAFAQYAAIECESYVRQHRTSLSNIGDQYRAFVASL